MIKVTIIVPVFNEQETIIQVLKAISDQSKLLKDFAFEVYFEKCLLDYASFDSKKLNKSEFKSCKMHEVNFTKADLSKSHFFNCDLYKYFNL